MALQNHPSLYSGGGERVDTRPHMMLYAQLKAREQAKNEAFDDYIRNLNKNVNPAGMRNQEREVFEEKLKQWQDYGMQNREALRNPRKDGGMASMQFQAGFQDLRNTIAESKTREEGKKPIVPLMLDPDKRDRMGEEFMTEISAHDAPLYVRGENGQWMRNPNSRPIDITKLDFEAKPFDQDDYFKGFSDVKPTQTTQAVKKLPGFKEEITTTSIFGPDEFDRIATKAVGRLGSDKSFRPFLKTLNPKDYNETFKAAYGKDIEDEGDLAAAYTLQGVQQSGTKKEIKDDKYAQGLSLEKIRQANRRELLNMRKAMVDADKESSNVWVDAYINKSVEESKKPENRQKYKFRDGKIVYGYKIPLDPVLRRSIGLDLDKSNGMLIATDEGDFIIAPYKTDEKYNPIKGKGGEYSIDPEKASRITKYQLKLALSKSAAGVKQTNIEMLDIEDEDAGILD